MSQRPSASRPASRSPPEDQRFVLPPVQLRDDLHQEGRQAERQQPEPESRGFPQRQETSPQHGQTSQNTGAGEEWRGARQQRDLGVHSILNPSEPEGAGNSSRRLSGATNESPISAAGRTPYGASPSTTPSHTFPGQQLPQGMAPRRILTPRSPSARAVSAGRGAPGTIDAQQSPFLPSRGRVYMAEPGPNASSEIPPMPNPGQQQYQQQYGFPPAASTPAIAPRRSSGGTMQAPGRTRLSQSASPSISASSNNPSSSQTSPASFLFHKGGTQPPSSYYSGSTFGTATQAGGGMQFQGPSGVPEGPYTSPDPQTQGSSLHSSSAGSSRQTSATDPIQVLTITTSQGSYTVPVDVHGASRLADEKRARNAGASARFRQRRKEKEREANTSIEKLQQQARELERRMRDVEQDRDRYRHERDRLRDMVLRNPDMRHLAMQGPPSPQSLQSGSFLGMGQPPPQQSLQPPQPPPQAGFHAETSSERAPRRRRTDTQGEFTSLPYSLPPASTLPPVPAPGYLGPPGPPNLPPLRIEQPPGPQTPGSNVTPSTSAGPHPPYDPYSRGPYERGWPGDGGRR
ncbi:hypothetical protein BKA61DRAFT_352324 [Leptodontidium sp. MPI-SDFR-AT-0119]|nr:hypothetical protein BKA61DRAFT_352324 [Leptodontidium sp. MPI-SDFR-AT-0119]